MDANLKNQEEKMDRRNAIKRIAKAGLALGGVVFLPSFPAFPQTSYNHGGTNFRGDANIINVTRGI